ncbi:MAG: SEC-C metal-binding domain-containing protein [Deltaproteobacteria bacterium]
MSSKALPPVNALSDDEFDRLAGFLETHSPFDTDGLLGVLNAIAVAPSLLQPSAWLTVVLPNGLGDLAKTEAEAFVGLLFRLHGDVLDALEHRQAVMPGPKDVAECKSFAAGYAAGAEIDPEWIGNEDRWTFASPMAYLGGRLDLVSQKTVEDIQLNFAPDPEQILCRQMVALISATSESFKEGRKSALSQMTPSKSHIPSRVGRNDPCPCGSGKKYKRCCIDSETEIDAP